MSVNVHKMIRYPQDDNLGQITITIDGNMKFIMSDQPTWSQAVVSYHNGDYDTLIRLMDNELLVREYLFEYEDIKVENGKVTFANSDVHSLCVDRIVEFCSLGENPMPLLRFLSKLQKNPSRRSVEELYRFLERNNLTVTTNGNFLAYKAVRPDMYSKTSGVAKLLKGKDDDAGRIFNGVGEEIEVYRNNVDDNAENGCSFGLHAGTLEYASSFASVNDVLLIVEIDPSDVVSVPFDCECQKLRTSRYKVVDICTQRLEKPVYESRFNSADDDEEWESDDVEVCPDCEWEVDDCQCDVYFLESEVNVKNLLGWLFRNDFDDLAHSLAKKFGNLESVCWEDVHNVEGDIDFLREIDSQIK